MTSLHVWTPERFPVPLPAGHAFPVGKAGLLREQLIAEGVLRTDDVHFSEPAPHAWLALAHDRAYVERACDGGLSDAEIRRLGLPWSPELALRARAAVFGTVMAARAARAHGVAGNLAGGSHHAFRDRAEGYCLFNDVAVAIEVLRAEGAARRPFVCDLDVHQGNGTAAMFAGDDDVFTFSMHARHNFPAHKVDGSLDVPLEDGCDDATFLAALDAHLPAALASHAPDIVFYQAGVDGLAADRLGRLALTHAGLAARDALVFALAARHRVPIVILLGGGYAAPLSVSVAAHANVWRAARAAHDVHASSTPVTDAQFP